ncbi:MAG TPA: hypothetical protein ENH06_01055 [bacterium]|nr:hypothetical protein [bacterium]
MLIETERNIFKIVYDKKKIRFSLIKIANDLSIRSSSLVQKNIPNGDEIKFNSKGHLVLLYKGKTVIDAGRILGL